MSGSEHYHDSERLSYARTASELSYELGIDSTILKSDRNLALRFFENDDYEQYRSTYLDCLKLAQKILDSSAIGASYRNLAFYHYIESTNDSSFYYNVKAREIYRRIGDRQNEAKVLFNMADLLETERDYYGSESYVIQSLVLLQNLPETEENIDDLWHVYNLLGLLSYELKNYPNAIKYHQNALEVSEKMENGFFRRNGSMNNMALVYREMKAYDKAISLHQELIDDSRLLEGSPEDYALHLGNLAYTKFLSDGFSDKEILKDYRRSFKMADTLDFDYGLMTASAHLAEYFMRRNESDSAIYYSNLTYDLAKDLSDNETVLESLFNMSKLVEGEKAKVYLTEHIKLSDSLLQSERSLRDKFARIEFETDQVIAENVQISRERLIFLISSIALAVTLLLLYIVISQRTRNRKLRFQQEQQKANEEIYNLMLAQQDKMEEGRTREKKRISEELHDGILGRLFGTRLSLDSLNLQNTDEAIKTRSQYIEELKSIEQEIRKISHDLNADFISGSSFSDILKTLVENQTQAFQLTYDYKEDDDIDWDELNNKTKIHIYRMLQESMQNVYKHANATHIKISFELKNDVILLSVEDNGSGFNIHRARKGIGLKNFDSRASEIGGKVEIFSKEGAGTRVKIFAPTG
ncbi:MAG: two-component sensor histidine kinase [Bacteroidia bacterium]|nr:two-component sensor histidine kinase [Bacteroidia bacterium]